MDTTTWRRLFKPRGIRLDVAKRRPHYVYTGTLQEKLFTLIEADPKYGWIEPPASGDARSVRTWPRGSRR